MHSNRLREITVETQLRKLIWPEACENVIKWWQYYNLHTHPHTHTHPKPCMHLIIPWFNRKRKRTLLNQHAQTVVRFRYKFRNNNQRNGLALCASLWDDVSQQNCSRQSRRTEGACTRCVLANRGDVLDDGLNKHSLCCRCEKTHLLPPSASQCSSNSCIGFSGSFGYQRGNYFLFSPAVCSRFIFSYTAMISFLCREAL